MPNTEVKGRFTSGAPEPFDEYKFLSDLKTLEKGSNVYDMYAFDKPSDLDGEKVYIGLIKLKS